MPDIGDADGAVSRDDIARLAPLFDRWFIRLGPYIIGCPHGQQCLDAEIQAL